MPNTISLATGYGCLGFKPFLTATVTPCEAECVCLHSDNFKNYMQSTTGGRMINMDWNYNKEGSGCTRPALVHARYPKPKKMGDIITDD